MAEQRAAKPGSSVDVNDVWNPLQKIDRRVMDALTNLEVLKLQGISKEEARTIIEYWAGGGMVRKRVEDAWVSESWTMSGGGVLGLLEKAVVRMKF
jgi:small subunit ribosomal protein S29